jgi:hypothetical protein
VTESSERKFSKCSDNGHPKEATIFQKNCNCTWLKFDLLMDTSKKRNGSSSRSSVPPLLSRFALGFFSLPRVSLLEGFFLRFFFGTVVAFTISLEVPFPTQPHPAGLAHFFDLTWLSDPHNLFAYRSVIYLLILF